MYFCCSVVSDSLQPMNHSLPGPCPWNSPGKNTGVGCYFLLQGIFPNPGIEPGSPALLADPLPSEPLGKQCNLESCIQVPGMDVLICLWSEVL